jgi:hypothetical protein
MYSKMIGACFARISKWVSPAPFRRRVWCPNNTERRLSRAAFDKPYHPIIVVRRVPRRHTKDLRPKVFYLPPSFSSLLLENHTGHCKKIRKSFSSLLLENHPYSFDCNVFGLEYFIELIYFF